MILTDKKEAVRQAIIKAVPSVMDLKFGCLISIGTANPQRYQCRILSEGLYHPEEIRKITTYGGEGLIIFEENLTDIKIIGRPITLADVLIAIDKKVGVQDTYYTVSMNGEIYKEDRENNIHVEIAFWNPLENFDHQSEVTYNFLWSLLCE